MNAPAPNIDIIDCRLCGWLLRAAWMGQELLNTFAGELCSLTLIPDETGGVFEIRLDGVLIWSRQHELLSKVGDGVFRRRVWLSFLRP